MASIVEAKADLTKLSERLAIIAEALRRLRSDHSSFFEDMEALREEMKAISAQLR